MEKLIEFLDECKHNRNINKNKNLYNIIDLDYVIERLSDIVGISGYNLTCPMCGGNMEYHTHGENGETHIWRCEQCPNVQFEYIDTNDLNNVVDMLENGQYRVSKISK